MDNINRQFLVNRHAQMAKDCEGVIEQLEMVRKSNPDFFLRTGGFSQIKMYEDEVKNQLSISKRQGEYHGLESV